MKTGTYKKYNLGGLMEKANPWMLGAAAATSLIGGISSALNYTPTTGKEKHLGDYLAATQGNPLNLIPELIKMNRDKNTVVSGSPGAYADGGDLPLSSNTFQVKGSPQTTDGNTYLMNQNVVKLDHNEVIDTNRNFVFSDDLKDGNKSFAMKAAKISRSVGKAEQALRNTPNDLQEQKTIEYANKELGRIAARQEAMAHSMGLRESSPTHMWSGGPGDKFMKAPIAGVLDPSALLYPKSIQERYGKVESLEPFNMLTRPQPVVGPDAGYRETPIQVKSNAAAPTISGIDLTKIRSNVDESTGLTTGDYLQLAEVGSKFFQTLRGPEREAQMMDNTRITKNSYDVRPQLYQSQRSFQNTANSIDSPSVNLRRSLMNNLYAGKLNSDSQIISQYDSMNKQANSQYEDRLSNQRRFNIQSAQYTNNLNAANRAAYDAVVQNAFTSVGNLGEAMNKRKYGYTALNLLKLRYPDVYSGVMNELK